MTTAIKNVHDNLLTVAGHSKVPVLSASTTLAIHQMKCILGDPDGSSLVVTLPPVREASGNFYSFSMPARTSGSWKVQDQDDSVDWTDQTLSGAGERILLYCDGQIWWIPLSTIS